MSYARAAVLLLVLALLSAQCARISDLKADVASRDADIATLTADIAKAEASARETKDAAEKAERAAIAAARDQLVEENEDARLALEAELADERARTVRLQRRFRACETTADLSRAAARAAGGDAAAAGELSAADQKLVAGVREELLRIGGEADAVVRELTACQAILNARR